MKESLTTWVTEVDFREIKELGFNSIRLPIGYWNVMKDPYELFAPRDYKDSLQYIDWCFDMADRSVAASIMLVGLA
jgi:aryl-phospho-beta-D-glucosidase BglC (GH1 family)